MMAKSRTSSSTSMLGFSYPIIRSDRGGATGQARARHGFRQARRAD
jgi:hypothetical protein